MGKINHYHVVIYSGGFDSTAVLMDVLNKVYYKTDEAVVILSVEGWFLTKRKMELEREARENVFDHFKKKYGKFWEDRVGYQLVSIDLLNEKVVPGMMYGGAKGLYQPELWASIMAPFLRKDCTIYLGYVKDDQGDYNLIKDAWISATKLACFDDKPHKIDVIIPFGGYLKEDVLMDLYINDKELIDICTCCELPRDDEKFCCSCNSCSEMIRSMINVIVKTNDIETIDFFTKRLQDWFGVTFTLNFKDDVVRNKYIDYSAATTNQCDCDDEKCDREDEPIDIESCDEKSTDECIDLHSAIEDYKIKRADSTYRELLHELKETNKVLRQISGRLH